MVLPLLGAIAPFAPLIGGVLGGLGQLFAPKPKPGSIDLQGLRRDAEAAGFNPLTIIRGGGLAGYGSAAPDMRLSNALTTFGSAVSQWNYDPLGMAKGRAELALAEAQIRSLGASGSPGARSNMSFETPKAVGATEERTPWTAFGITFSPSPWFSDAQTAETRHGELVDWAWGLATLPSDVAYTAWKDDWAGGAARLVGGAWNGVGGSRAKEPLRITVRGGAGP